MFWWSRFLLFLVGVALASSPSVAMAEEMTKPQLVPHRAIYKMSLASLKNGSSLLDADGTMVFEWADACSGWAIQQQMDLHFTYAEMDESTMSSRSVTWESKDGKQYRFNVRRISNGEEDQNFRGKVDLSSDKPKISYSMPADKKGSVDKNVIFPSSHTLMILDKAFKGESFFTKRVFDGSDDVGSADVSVFIGKRGARNAYDEQNRKITDNPALLAEPSWPVRLAFFSDDSETGEPDYEMDIALQPNGIVRSMVIDYGDFSILGNLVKLEAIPEPGC